MVLAPELSALPGVLAASSGRLQPELVVLRRLIVRNRAQHRRTIYFRRVEGAERALTQLGLYGAREGLSPLVEPGWADGSGARGCRIIAILCELDKRATVARVAVRTAAASCLALLAHSYFMPFALTSFAILARARSVLSKVVESVVRARRSMEGYQNAPASAGPLPALGEPAPLLVHEPDSSDDNGEGLPISPPTKRERVGDEQPGDDWIPLFPAKTPRSERKRGQLAATPQSALEISTGGWSSDSDDDGACAKPEPAKPPPSNTPSPAPRAAAASANVASEPPAKRRKKTKKARRKKQRQGGDKPDAIDDIFAGF